MLKIDILTIFPEMFSGPFKNSIIKRAQEKNKVKIKIHNLRDWTKDKHRTVDDRPYGGGPGMIMKVDVIDRALENLKTEKEKVILLTPQGEKFSQDKAKKLAESEHLILICGHYEGFDYRVKNLVDEEISIGDYVLTGGEIPAMVITDSVIRLLPGVLGNKDSIESESFSQGQLEYPQYTRPENYKGMKVPKLLLSGDHEKIKKWRQEQSQQLTRQRRPDLMS